MKKYLFTGFVSLLPLTLTIMIVQWLFNLFTDPLAGLMQLLILSLREQLHLSPELSANLILFLSKICSLILLFVLILVLGILGQKVLGRFFLKIPEMLFAKIPFIRTIFRVSHDITKAVFSEDKKTLKETLLIPFPNKESYAVGFATGTTPPLFQKENAPTDLVVFIPTAPHPISGFVLFVPQSVVKKVDIPVEDAFKFLISCGALHPKGKD